MAADQVSRELGRSRKWTANVAAPGRDPKLSTVAAVAAVTGHRLAILDAESGEVVATIDAPERAEGES